MCATKVSLEMTAPANHVQTIVRVTANASRASVCATAATVVSHVIQRRVRTTAVEMVFVVMGDVSVCPNGRERTALRPCAQMIVTAMESVWKGNADVCRCTTETRARTHAV